jgi:hypothetical protein
MRPVFKEAKVNKIIGWALLTGVLTWVVGVVWVVIKLLGAAM